MTIPKFVSDRDKWDYCPNCNTTGVSCKGQARDRGRPCCSKCTHQEESHGDD